MRLRQLKCFVRVCELGSISRAAVELNIAQPALGVQIRALEHEFGVELLVRSSRGVTPTKAGELVMEHSRDLIQQDRDLRMRLKQLDQEEPAAVKLALTASLVHLIAGPLIERMGERYPRTRLELMEGASELVVQWIEEERADVGLGFGPFPSRTVQGTAILKERLYYLSGQDNSSEPIALGEILSRPLALPNEQSSLRTVVEEGARAIDMPVIGTYEIASLDANRSIARRGIAGTIVPYGGIADDVNRGDLSARMIVEPMLERPMFVWRRTDRGTEAIDEELVAIVIEELRRAATERLPEGTYIFLDRD